MPLVQAAVGPQDIHEVARDLLEGLGAAVLQALAGAKDGSKDLRRFMAWGILAAGNPATPEEEKKAFEWMRESAEAGEAATTSNASDRAARGLRIDMGYWHRVRGLNRA